MRIYEPKFSEIGRTARRQRIKSAKSIRSMRKFCAPCSRMQEKPASNSPRSSAYRHRVVSAGNETWSSVASFEATAPTSTPRFSGSHSRSLPPCSWSATCAAMFKPSRKPSLSSPGAGGSSHCGGIRLSAPRRRCRFGELREFPRRSFDGAAGRGAHHFVCCDVDAKVKHFTIAMTRVGRRRRRKAALFAAARRSQPLPKAEGAVPQAS